MNNINSSQLKEMIAANNNVVVVDVRTADEVNGGIIEGALHYDIFSSDFASNIKSLDKSKAYAMVCRSGNRSASACGLMEANGFSEVYNLDGGMMAWDGETV